MAMQTQDLRKGEAQNKSLPKYWDGNVGESSCLLVVGFPSGRSDFQEVPGKL